jgi:hypothetical protein
VAQHRLAALAEYYLGNFFYLQASSGFSLLEDPLVWAWNKMEPVQVSGRAFWGSQWSATWQGVFNPAQERWTSAFASLSARQSLWRFAANTSYAFRQGFANPHSTYLGLNAAVKPHPFWTFDGLAQYELAERRWNWLSFGIGHNLHCWEIQGRCKIYQDREFEIALGINLVAFPEVRAGMGSNQGPQI